MGDYIYENDTVCIIVAHVADKIDMANFFVCQVKIVSPQAVSPQTISLRLHCCRNVCLQMRHNLSF